jgi:hypothetical protein
MISTLLSIYLTTKYFINYFPPVGIPLTFIIVTNLIYMMGLSNGGGPP